MVTFTKTRYMVLKEMETLMYSDII